MIRAFESTIPSFKLTIRGLEAMIQRFKPSAYKVQRRKRSEGGWENVGTATECSIELANQQRGIEWEYTIVATNKAGDAPLSNIVMAVL